MSGPTDGSPKAYIAIAAIVIMVAVLLVSFFVYYGSDDVEANDAVNPYIEQDEALSDSSAI